LFITGQKRFRHSPFPQIKIWNPTSVGRETREEIETFETELPDLLARLKEFRSRIAGSNKAEILARFDGALKQMAARSTLDEIRVKRIDPEFCRSDANGHSEIPTNQ
jgi:hypothetical protein